MQRKSKKYPQFGKVMGISRGDSREELNRVWSGLGREYVCVSASHDPRTPDTDRRLLTGVPNPSFPLHCCADNGNLIGGSGGGGGEGGGGGPSFVRNSSKRQPAYLSTGALCNRILHCHFAPFIFRQGYYCCRSPHRPLRLCVQGRAQVLTSFFTLFFPSSTFCAHRVMDHTGNGGAANSRSPWKQEGVWSVQNRTWCRFLTFTISVSQTVREQNTFQQFIWSFIDHSDWSD